MNVADRMKHVLINLKALGISGANAANVVAGTDGPDVLKGRDGADNIAGQGGNDRLVGRGGRDKLDGGDGNDWLFGGDGNDELIGGLGKRGKLNGGNGDDLLVPGPGYDRLYGGNGVDTVTYDAAVKRVVVELEFGSIGGGGAHRDRLDSIENVVASPYDDIVEGSASSNVLRGGAGNDWLTDVPFATSKDRFEGGDGDDFLAAGRGKDKLFGGHGDDMLDGGGGGDRLDGGAGNDTASYWDSKGVTASLADRSINTGVARNDRYFSIENLAGSSRNDTLIGDEVENSIDGRYGNDHLQGNGGNDILRGEDGRDVLDGGAGDDVLYGSPASDMGLWSDHDKLVGGPGADLFVFVDVPWSGADLDEADVLMDFDRSEGDTVDLAAIDANVLSEGNQPFSFVGGAAFSGAAGELRYYGSGDDTIVQADIDGDAAADLVIVLKGTIALVSSDFLL